jgi:hypothetical protein
MGVLQNKTGARHWQSLHSPGLALPYPYVLKKQAKFVFVVSLHRTQTPLLMDRIQWPWDLLWLKQEQQWPLRILLGPSIKLLTHSTFVQLTAKEERSISLTVTGDKATTTRRLNLILCVKDAYIKAIGQQAGFDHSRINCDIPGK